MNPTPPRLLTVQQAAEYLGVSPVTVRRRITSGTLAVVRDGGIIRVSERALVDYVAAHTRPAAAIRTAPRAAPRPRRRSAPRGAPSNLGGEPGRLRRLWEVDA